MMHGTRELFEYAECAACGTLQIKRAPRDLGRHYPTNYYSLQAVAVGQKPSRYKAFLRQRIAAHMLGQVTPLGWVLSKAVSSAYPWYWFRATQCGFQSSILDVGCGRGDLLWWLRQHGFYKLHGIDPFLSQGTEVSGLLIEKKSLSDVEGEYDLVMSHHSLEHVAEPLHHIEKMKSLCTRGGYLLIRMPVLGASWRGYGRDWVELDAPRHLWVPTVTGLKKILARVGGLRIERILFDTTEFEFYGSEMYHRDISLHDSAGKRRNPREIFSPNELDEFRRRAWEYNRNGQAGRAVFVVRCVASEIRCR
jgi:SAM-dependent methyltransferase